MNREKVKNWIIDCLHRSTEPLEDNIIGKWSDENSYLRTNKSKVSFTRNVIEDSINFDSASGNYAENKLEDLLNKIESALSVAGEYKIITPNNEAKIIKK
ncbi:TPA: hypothetical protein ACT9JI_003122 [Legionella pneumophila]